MNALYKPIFFTFATQIKKHRKNESNKTIYAGSYDAYSLHCNCKGTDC